MNLSNVIIHAAMPDKAEEEHVGQTFKAIADAAMQVGPLVGERLLKQEMGYLVTAAKNACKFTGGGRIDGATMDFCVAPTLAAEIRNEMRVSGEEVSRLSAAVIKISDYNAVLVAANGTGFCPQLGIGTTSTKHAFNFNSKLQIPW